MSDDEVDWTPIVFDPPLDDLTRKWAYPGAMTIAILGTGNIGGALAKQLNRAGVAGLLGERNPATAKLFGPHTRSVSIADALQADIVVLAIPFAAIRDAVGRWNGRIVVDATNAIDFTDFTPTDLGGRPSTEVVAELVPGARVVKAFNTFPAALLAMDPASDGGRRMLTVAGDHADANAEVMKLAEQLGFAAIDLGKLAEGGRLMQFAGPLTVKNFVVHG